MFQVFLYKTVEEESGQERSKSNIEIQLNNNKLVNKYTVGKLTKISNRIVIDLLLFFWISNLFIL